LAYGRLGWKPNDLDVFTFDEMVNALKGLDKVWQEKWAIARQLGVWILEPHVKKGKKLKPTDLLKLDIDGKETQKPLKPAKVTRNGKH